MSRKRPPNYNLWTIDWESKKKGKTSGKVIHKNSLLNPTFENGWYLYNLYYDNQILKLRPKLDVDDFIKDESAKWNNVKQKVEEADKVYTLLWNTWDTTSKNKIPKTYGESQRPSTNLSYFMSRIMDSKLQSYETTTSWEIYGRTITIPLETFGRFQGDEFIGEDFTETLRQN